MKCETCETLLVEHAHGELDPGAARELANHLGGCGDCATAYCRLEADLGGIASAHVERPRAAVRDAMRRRVKAEFSPPFWRRAAAVVARPIPAYGAVMVALVPVLLWVASASEPAPAITDASGGAAPTAKNPAPAPRVRNYDASNIPRIYRGVL